MTILVTGGAGFIGSNFVLDWLARCDEPVVNLDRLVYPTWRASLAALAGDARHLLVEGDIGDARLVADLLERHRPRAVVHLAAESHVDYSIAAPERFLEANVTGTFTLLQAVRAWLDRQDQTDAATRAAFRFLHVSTDEVYGSLVPGVASFTEAHPYLPNNPYAASKAAGDHLARAWHHTFGVPVIISHCSNNYGRHQMPEKLIPRLIARALAGQALPLYGDGLHVRDWLHVADHCAALRLLLERAAAGSVWNVGGGNERSNRAVAEAVCAALDGLRPRADGRSYREQIALVADRAGHDRRYAIDARKLTTELGWRPGHAFEQGLHETVRWYVEHPDWLRMADAGRSSAG